MKRTALVALLLPLAGCGQGYAETPTVFAAASLQESFTELAEDFEIEHGVEVEFNFGPSSGLAEQINAGAPADVLASASVTTMNLLERQHEAEVFATNTMQVVVPPDNPAGITTVQDLTEPGTKVVLCQVRVPCGAVATEILEQAGVDLEPVSEETDVKAVLTKVQLGEADAGLVYVTDVIAAGDKVRGVAIPEAQNAATDYPIAALNDEELAQAWVDLVLSEKGREVLHEHGFSAP